MQKEKSGIIGELSDMVAKHASAEEETLKLNTMVSEHIKSIDAMRKKNKQSMTGKTDI